MFIGHLYVFFEKLSIEVICPFFLNCVFLLLLFNCMSCLCILEFNPLSIALFANIFSHSDGCLFFLFIVFFAVQKL